MHGRVSIALASHMTGDSFRAKLHSASMPRMRPDGCVAVLMAIAIRAQRVLRWTGDLLYRIKMAIIRRS